MLVSLDITFAALSFRLFLAGVSSFRTPLVWQVAKLRADCQSAGASEARPGSFYISQPEDLPHVRVSEGDWTRGGQMSYQHIFGVKSAEPGWP